MNSLAEEYINNKWVSMHVYTGRSTTGGFYIWGEHPVERIVEHHRTILEGGSRYFFVKLETRKYSEPIELKLLNALWERRAHYLTDEGWTDRLYANDGSICFSVWNDSYWETVYRLQGKRYPRPRRRKSKVWRERMGRKAVLA